MRELGLVSILGSIGYFPKGGMRGFMPLFAGRKKFGYVQAIAGRVRISRPLVPPLRPPRSRPRSSKHAPLLPNRIK
jgi:hypothetical protein